MKLLAIAPEAFRSRSALREKMTLTVGAEAFRRPSAPTRMYDVVDGVAIIRIVGDMIATPDPYDVFMGGFTNTRGLTRAVQLAAADSAVKAIVLHVDSPGGSVDGLAELGDAVSFAARIKPVVAVVEGMAASAAYYAIAGASEVIAGRMDMVGSIGTILVVYDASEAFKTTGLRVVPITTGKYKAVGTFGTPLTADEEQYLRGIIDAYFDDFRRAIMRGRGRLIGPAEWTTIADAKIFLADEAKRLGLIDRFGTLGDTLNRLHGERQAIQARSQRSFFRVTDLKVPRRRMSDRERGQRAALQMMELTGGV